MSDDISKKSDIENLIIDLIRYDPSLYDKSDKNYLSV